MDCTQIHIYNSRNCYGFIADLNDAIAEETKSTIVEIVMAL